MEEWELNLYFYPSAGGLKKINRTLPACGSYESFGTSEIHILLTYAFDSNIVKYARMVHSSAQCIPVEWLSCGRHQQAREQCTQCQFKLWQKTALCHSRNVEYFFVKPDRCSWERNTAGQSIFCLKPLCANHHDHNMHSSDVSTAPGKTVEGSIQPQDARTTKTLQHV